MESLCTVNTDLYSCIVVELLYGLVSCVIGPDLVGGQSKQGLTRTLVVVSLSGHTKTYAYYSL